MLWLSSWLADQEVWGSITDLTATTISEIDYLLIPSLDMAEIPLKRHTPGKSSKQPTNFHMTHDIILSFQAHYSK